MIDNFADNDRLQDTDTIKVKYADADTDTYPARVKPTDADKN